MSNLKDKLAALPTITAHNQTYLSVQAVIGEAALFLFPALPPEQIDEEKYRHILETAETCLRELGYTRQEPVTPPTVPLSQAGQYWVHDPSGCQSEDPEWVILAGPGWVEEMQAGRLIDTRLGHLADVSRQHFKIPVTASEPVYDLMKQAVETRHWHNDWAGVWHDILTMASRSRQHLNPHERAFNVIIRGVGQWTLWPMKLCLYHDPTGNPYLVVELADEQPPTGQLFTLGRVVMTAGVAALGVNISPYLLRHARGDWGETLDEFDKQQNNLAVREGWRILSAYDMPVGNGRTERIWLITEADRAVTTALLPAEY